MAKSYDVIVRLGIKPFNEEFLEKLTVEPICLVANAQELFEMLEADFEADVAVKQARKDIATEICKLIPAISAFGVTDLVLGGPLLRSRRTAYPLGIVVFVKGNYYFKNDLLLESGAENLSKDTHASLTQTEKLIDRLAALGCPVLIVDGNQGPHSPMGEISLEQCGHTEDLEKQQPLLWCCSPEAKYFLTQFDDYFESG